MWLSPKSQYSKPVPCLSRVTSMLTSAGTIFSINSASESDSGGRHCHPCSVHEQCNASTYHCRFYAQIPYRIGKHVDRITWLSGARDVLHRDSGRLSRERRCVFLHDLNEFPLDLGGREALWTDPGSGSVDIPYNNVLPILLEELK